MRRFLLLFLFSTQFLLAIDIGQLHQNDADGQPSAPYTVGSQVTVQGIVTAGVGVFSSSRFDIYIQDETGGINVFAPSIPQVFRQGDEIQLTAFVNQENGLTRLTEPSEMSPLSFRNPLPPPVVLTCEQVAAAFLDDYSEPHESRLVRVNNVSVIQNSGNPYIISDGNAQCSLVVDDDTDIRIPEGVFDIIGILKQNDDSPPYSSGYFLTPRFQNDIVERTGPTMTQQPVEINITPTTVTLQWQTQQPATAILQYGTTENIELGEIEITESRITQSAVIRDLQPATLYYAKVVATDALGSVESRTLLFSTASDESLGRIHVYFNKSVNSEVQWLEPAMGNVDLSTIMIERMNAAQHTLDIALYSFTHDDLYWAIHQAHQRGVSVRLIYDDDQNDNNNFITWLRDTGVPCISDAFGDNSGDAHMHNKFIVADARDHTTGADDWLVAGSANFSYAGAENNAENLVTINDQALAAAYTREFNEMWGSSSETPNAEHSRMGANKLDNTPHRFNVGGVWIEQYMSPSDNTEQYIINSARTADFTLDFCILAFTRASISNAFQDRFYNVPGLMVRGVFDAGSKNTNDDIYDAMSGSGTYAWSPPADVHWDGTTGTLHHKYLLVDGSFRDSDPTVVTGSHNWSNNANFRNDENTLIIHDAHIANLYYQEFVKRYREAGGRSDITVEVTEPEHRPDAFVLFPNAPNPFNHSTVIEFTLPQDHNEAVLIITDVLGRQVLQRTFNAASGRQRLVWDAKNSNGSAVASGIYTATLRSEHQAQSIKLLYLR